VAAADRGCAAASRWAVEFADLDQRRVKVGKFL
jgi:hypothetical protein